MSCTGHARIRAVLAGRMLCMLAALGFAARANVEGDGCKLGKGGGALSGEGKQRTTYRQQFANALGACSHRFVAVCEHFVAMAQAHLSFAYTIAGSVH